MSSFEGVPYQNPGAENILRGLSLQAIRLVGNPLLGSRLTTFTERFVVAEPDREELAGTTVIHTAMTSSDVIVQVRRRDAHNYAGVTADLHCGDTDIWPDIHRKDYHQYGAPSNVEYFFNPGQSELRVEADASDKEYAVAVIEASNQLTTRQQMAPALRYRHGTYTARYHGGQYGYEDTCGLVDIATQIERARHKLGSRVLIADAAGEGPNLP